ncbi:hypothetical protein Droror1_Dr00014447 [Drosera rotundifolia]
MERDLVAGLDVKNLLTKQETHRSQRLWIDATYDGRLHVRHADEEAFEDYHPGGMVPRPSWVRGMVPRPSWRSRIITLMKRRSRLHVRHADEEAFEDYHPGDKVFDAVEAAGKSVMSTTSVVTAELVYERYGEEAARQPTQEIGTAWAIFKIRKAINPKSILKPTVLARAAAEGGSLDAKTKVAKQA